MAVLNSLRRAFKPTPEEELQDLKKAVEVFERAKAEKRCSLCTKWIPPSPDLPGFVDNYGDCWDGHIVNTIEKCPDYVPDEDAINRIRRLEQEKENSICCNCLKGVNEMSKKNEKISSIEGRYPTEFSILGQKWTLMFVDPKKKGSGFEGNLSANGFCNSIGRKIVLRCEKAQHFPEDFTEADKIRALNKTLRHETVHAFLYESGLNRNTFSGGGKPWAANEEMVDWFAIQGPKIMELWDSIGCVD